MKSESQYNLIAIVLVVSSVSFMSCAPTNNEEMNYLDRTWVVSVTPIESITTTTPTPEQAEISCDQATKVYDNIFTDAITEDINQLMNEYNEWGKLLAPTPVAIGILGQLILMANQLQDFPVNNEDSPNPKKTFQHLKFPNSFRKTMLQISHQGYMAFFTAHRNMDVIRVHNDAVSNDIKDAVRYLASSNERIINLRLHRTLDRINNAIEKSQALSNEVVDQFTLVLRLIVETELAVSSTKSLNENRLDDVNFDLKLNNQSSELSEKENSILIEKDRKMKKMLEMLEDRKGHLYIFTSYENESFIVNLANDWIKEIGRSRYKKVKKFLEDKSQTWNYSYNHEYVYSNPCAQENSEQLLDLLIAFGQYRLRYEHWQNSARNNMSLFDGSSTISNLEITLKNLKQCTEIENIFKKGNNLVNNLKDSNVFQLSNKKIPYESEIDEIIISINNMRIAAYNVTEKSDTKIEIKADSAWDLYGELKRHQLDQLNSMSKTVEDIVKLNHNLMETRKNKTREILDRIVILNITKMSTENVIQILRDGLEELGKLKNHWGELILFFGKIRTFIESAFRHNAGLVQIVQAMSRNPSVDMKDKSLLRNLGINFEKSNEAVLLVKGIADMYVNLSNLYVKDRLARLDKINSLRITDSQEKLKRETEILTIEATEASREIEANIQEHEKKLIETLHLRHKEIIRSYRKMLYCIRTYGLTDRAVNFSAADFWFQIKSLKNSKVLEVSSENQVQMWESNGRDNQMWYFDHQKIIRSVTNDFCLTSHGIKQVTVEPCLQNTLNQKWTLKDGMILNIDDYDRCLDVLDQENINGACINEVKTNKNKELLWKMII